MGVSIDHSSVWRLIRRQHGVIARRQLVEFDFTAKAIQHRLETGRIRVVFPGVYAVGQLELTQKGWWMAAVLACGYDAVLSHDSAAALWGIRKPRRGPIHVTVPAGKRVRLEGIRPHQRKQMPPTTTIDSIPLSQPLFTLIDLAASLPERALEAAVNEADKLRLINPKHAQRELDDINAPGIARLRKVLSLHKRTDSDLERDFLRLLRKHGLPDPQTQQRFACGRVDFYWPNLNLVVETDGTAYHRTPSQQIRDRRRDQAHARAGRTSVRFLDVQIDHHPDEVVGTLAALIAQQLE